jgi:GntR family phosphonate transport system transcriptional regulator
VAYFRSIFPVDRLPGIAAALEETNSVTTALDACGLPDYTRASTRISAARATPSHALHLRCREGDPVLHTRSLNVAPDGQPVEYGNTWYAADRVTLTLDHDETA